MRNLSKEDKRIINKIIDVQEEFERAGFSGQERCMLTIAYCIEQSASYLYRTERVCGHGG